MSGPCLARRPAPSLATLLLGCLAWLVVLDRPSISEAAADLQHRTVSSDDEARSVLAEARARLLGGSYEEAIMGAESLCGDATPAVPLLQASHPSSILGVACLNLLGLGLFMRGGEEERADAALTRAQQLATDRHQASGVWDLVELESLKNLQWSLQCANDEARMLAVREALSTAILQSNGVLPREPLARGLSASFFDLGLNHQVCRRLPAMGNGSEAQGGRLYVDLVKRCVSYFLHSDMPHALMPRGPQWDIYYRMRDFQTVPPSNGQRFEDGLTTKEVGVLDLIEQAAVSVLRSGVEGHWLEAGVWRGGTAILLAAIAKAYTPLLQPQLGADSPPPLSRRRVVLADSFEGIPASSLSEWEERYAVSKHTVADNLRRFGLLDDDVVFVEGFFSSSLPQLVRSPPPLLTKASGEEGAAGEPLRLSLLLADADAFDSTRDVLSSLYPSLSVGGVVVIDDFHIPECRDAVLRYRRARGIHEPMLPVPTDYAFGCLADEEGGSVLPPAEEGGLVSAWPHAMYWRRRLAEEDLRRYDGHTANHQGLEGEATA